LRAAGSAFLLILALSVAVGWIEAVFYMQPAFAFIDRLWVFAIDGSMAFFLALPLAVGWALCEGFLPEAWLRLAGPDRKRRVTAIGLAWALWPTLSLALPQRGLPELLAIVAMVVLIRLICRWMPPVSLPLSGVVAGMGGLMIYVLSAFADKDLRMPPFELPERALAAGDVRDQRPCILLISADTLRDDRVGALRNGAAVTPFLDSLAATGRRSSCISSSNQTGPGHASMLTGASILRHGVIGNGMAVQAEIVTMAELLQANGWRTAGIVSNPVLESVGGYARGFEAYGDMLKASIPQANAYFTVKRFGSRWRWLVRVPRLSLMWLSLAELKIDMTPKILQPRADEVYQRSRPVIEALAADPRPFFFFAHFMDPHHPFDSPPETRGKWTQPEEMDGIPLRTTESFQVFRDALERRAQKGDQGAFYTGEILQRLYDEEILAMDGQIKALYDDARRAAGDRPLWLLFTSDHGEHFLEYGLLGHANSLYEELVRVPLIVNGVPDMHAADYPERLEDVAPFLIRRALGDKGEAAATLLRKNSPVMAPGASIAVWGTLACYRAGQWKLILKADKFMGQYEPVRLYDMASAEGERVNVATSHPDQVERMTLAFRAAQAQSVPVVHKALEGGLAERLRTMLNQMGYVDSHAEPGN
jgi:arylsulfatase A-like enzyme